eukprot:TRINITY_DN4217_c0_g1_i1.p1 TRINITY_DN4217_c0_g1~~TRINITY_DN4217_c0_g1_i1.p1  ORF type:complete len:366 (+),score=73.90 TRINITY_DN4217_c0_g1_i1:51-1148(+)
MSNRLALVFDVNRTILIDDPAAGKSAEDEVCTILASSIYGKVMEDTWIPDEDYLIKTDHNISYKDYIEEVYQFPDMDDSMTIQQKSKAINDCKNLRRAAIKVWMNPGQPGSSFKAIFDEYVAHLVEPENFSLLLSFYTCIVKLVESGYQLSICFRTFGQDIYKIFEEFNRFCAGEHPSFQGMFFDGTNKTQDLTIKIENVGHFIRTGTNSEDVSLNMGTALYDEDVSTVITGFNDINQFVQGKYQNGETLALRDNYEWWAANKENCRSGKVLFIDPIEWMNPNRTRVRQYYFDDHMFLERYLKSGKFIADIRHPVTGEPIRDFEKLLGIVIHRADGMKSIPDSDYFLNLVETGEEFARCNDSLGI